MHSDEDKKENNPENKQELKEPKNQEENKNKHILHSKSENKVKIKKETSKFHEKSEKIHNKEKIRLSEKINIFFDKHYKKILFGTSTLLLIIILIIIGNFIITGDIVKKGIDLQGGVSVTINKNINYKELESFLKQQLPKSDIKVSTISSGGSIVAVTIEASDISDAELIDKIKEKISIERNDYVVEVVGATLGSAFFKQAMIAVIAAFLLMAVVVYITFRNIVPSLFVMLCAASDIIATWAVVILSGERLSSAGVAAFLMMIGYSVDTDILLTTRVLKHKEGTIHERVMQSMKTGLTMSLTGAAATFIAFIITPSPALKQIMFILTIGLLFDIIFTWGQNAQILRWYLENKEKSR